MIEGHGDDAWKYKVTINADFSTNVWHGGLNAGLQAHLQDTIATITHYPEAAAQTLQGEAAANYGVRSDQVLVTNGATEAIYLIAQAFRPLPPDRNASSHKKWLPAGGIPASTTILTPAFSEYEDACRGQGVSIQRQPWTSVTAETRFADGLVFCCNPNNPTGATLPVTLLRQLIQTHSETIFVVDESYIEFTRATKSILPLLDRYHNLLILRSLTKSCCIPGLRIGFAIGGHEIISQLRACKMPWSVNQLAIEAARYIFRHPQSFALPLDRLLDDTARWQKELQAATGWRIHDTDTHYFLVEIGDSSRPMAPFTAAALKFHLVSRHGLLIRDASNFYGLTPFHFRVACQSPDHNQLLTDALRQCSRTGI